MSSLTARLKYLSFILVWLFVSPAFADLTPEQQTAKERGSILYHQFKAISAEPYLTIAAEAGDSESQFLLAEALRKNNRYMTEEAYHWLDEAARQGMLI